MPDKLTPDSICTHCGRPLREHCVSRDSRQWYRMCATGLRATDADHWGSETGADDGEHCIKCGWSVQDHYQWRRVQFVVMGAVIVPENPVAMELTDGWLGCGPVEE